MIQIQRLALLSTLALGCLTACSPKVQNEGYVKEAPIQEQVILGETNRDQVKAKLGSPSSQSSFGKETWYYVTDRKESYAFFKPDIVQQDVVGVEFDNAGIVDKLDHYTKKDSEEFTLVKRTTPTEGHTLGFFEQLLGNIGRFNGPAGGTDSSAPGRKASSGGL